MPPKRGKSAYKFPERLPEGEVLQDMRKNRWILGPSIGKGGFGEIYSAASYVDGKPKDYPYVIKIEPHENGPLFVEMHFYQKVGKLEDVDAWKTKEKVNVLGIPAFYGSGSHTFENYKYRFIVIDRFGKDLWSIFLDNKKSFAASTVFKCALQILDVLKYIHEKGYIHGDIKGANLLLGYKENLKNNVFLVDFGLACKHSSNEFKPNPKRAGDGTIEYTSCDMHVGVPTRRGDLEILGYNLLHWLSGGLPWEADIKSQETVLKKKKEFMEDIRKNLKKHFPRVPEVMLKYFHYVSKLKHDEIPDTKFCKSLFLNELKSTSSLEGPLFPHIKNSSRATQDSTEPENKKAKVAKPRGRTTKPKEDGTKSTGEKTEETKRVTKPRGRTPKSKQAGSSPANVTATEDEQKRVAQPRGRKAKSKENGKAESSDDMFKSDSSEEEEDEKPPAKRVRRSKIPPKDEAKPSWKDAPTVAWTRKKQAVCEANSTENSRKKK